MTAAGADVSGGGGGEQPASGPARCYRHPNRETLIRCTRCDRPICPDCMRPASVGFHCPDDVALAAKTVRAPRTSVGAALRDSPPYVTGTLMVLNALVYVITGTQSVQGVAHPAHGSNVFEKWQLLPSFVYYQDQYYRLITSAFLHLSLLHIASNMRVVPEGPCVACGELVAVLATRRNFHLG